MDGACGEPDESALQPTSMTCIAATNIVRKVSFMAFFILAKQGSVKQAPGKRGPFVKQRGSMDTAATTGGRSVIP
jgi:hypothetical protein